MSTVVISGGGTGGHIYPGIAIADLLKEKGFNVFFIGTKAGMESRIVPEKGYPIKFVNVKGFMGKSFYKKIFALLLLPVSVFHALILLLKIKPDFVIITGGYVSLPVSVASAILRKTIYLQEQNAYPGLVNKISAKFVKYAFTGFKDKSGVFKEKEIFTGNPVRKEFLSVPKLEDDAKSRFSLLVAGGSQGSLFINNLVREMLEKTGKLNIKITHLTGEKWFKDFEKFKSDNYFPVAYSNNMPELLKQADLVISRAGASMLAELSATGRPAILIPLKTATNNHQYYNGMSFAEAKAGEVLLEDDATADRLLEIVKEFVLNRRKTVEFSENAKKVFPENSTEAIVEKILEDVK
jgi:UDP-N-acetylglucosamine--N-acetylmuramyl-(pentapeptide) pyrophosphoryl-undecaprenol N-acetylglucosamine transferase